MIKIGYSGVKRKPYRVNQGGYIKLHNGDKMYVETGYLFDNASIPKFAKFLHDTFGVEFFHYKDISFLIHDYLYNFKGYRKSEDSAIEPVSRSFADREMFLQMLNRYSLKKSLIFFRAVRLFGWRSFGKI
jgi:hypothetical protein